MKSNLYTNGVVSALTNSLISKETFNRMIDAKNYDEAFSVLSETSFGSTSESESINSREEILNLETKKLLNFVKTESPSEEFTKYILLTYDYANILNFCRCQLLGIDFLSYVEAEGLYTLSQIKEYILSKHYDNFNNTFIKEALIKFNDISATNVDGWEVDFIFKKYMYQNLLQVCFKQKVLKGLIINKIDAENLSVALRAKTQFQLESQLLEGGSLTKNTLIKIFKREKNVLSGIKQPILNQMAKLCMSEDSLRYSKFEKIKNTIELKLLLPKQYDIESIAPFVLYVYKVLTQIKNVRLILSYQFNNLKDKIVPKFLEVKVWKKTLQ